jgi:hypothetical protein
VVVVVVVGVPPFCEDVFDRKNVVRGFRDGFFAVCVCVWVYVCVEVV